jgi:epoxyqueuosine reductase
VARRLDLNLIMPGVKSIIVVGLQYWPGPPISLASDPAHGSISCYAQNTDYHHVMIQRLDRLLEFLGPISGEPVRGRAYVDTGPLLERDHAVRAGLGFIGKNTTLIRPSSGSWLFLGELLLELDLEPDIPPKMPSCGRCHRCQEACPTQAFVEPYVLDSRRCISYWTTTLKGIIPRESRSLMRNHIFGCDVCQTVCPWNRFAVPQSSAQAQQAPPLLDLLGLSANAFEVRFGHSPIGHIGYDRFMRNVIVAAGNWAAPVVARPLAQLLQDGSPLVQIHAAWALGRVGTQPARTALLTALAENSDQAVRREIAHVLQE